VHLFLDGAPTDLAVRSAHMKQSVEQLTQVARTSARASMLHGVSLMRDAGDKYGINNAIRAEAMIPGSGLPHIRSGGIGMRRPKRYGAFMATDVTDDETIKATTRRLADANDEVKLILTGIIDFEAGAVTDEPQFTLDEVRLVVETARSRHRTVFAHCSGLKGLEIASRAGVGSIEHGFFMTEAVLETMRRNDVAWTPTFSPVHVQWAHPEPMNWSAGTIGHLADILANHARHLLRAHEIGVTLLLGTDAGSMGVEHGKAMLTEMQCYLDAGLPLRAVLRAATSTPRRRFGESHPVLRRGSPFDVFCYPGDPRERLTHLARPDGGWIGGIGIHPSPATDTGPSISD
jgi:imidazolonepropionase-like amidohydrolase